MIGQIIFYIVILAIAVVVCIYEAKLVKFEEKLRIAAVKKLRQKLRSNKAIRAWAKDYRQPFVIESDNLLYKFEIRI
jgi:hypothetical protein